MAEENKKKEETITIRTSTFWKYGTFIFAILFLLSIFGAFNGSSNNVGVNVANQQGDNLPSVGGSVKVEIEANDPLLGNKNAEVSIVEFSDFQCPFCARAHTGALADLRESDY